jgi:hypothetical protein
MDISETTQQPTKESASRSKKEECTSILQHHHARKKRHFAFACDYSLYPGMRWLWANDLKIRWQA